MACAGFALSILAFYPGYLTRPPPWLALVTAVGAPAWRRRATPSGAYAINVAAQGSSIFCHLPVRVAADFRYAYWCRLASLAGLVSALLARRGPSNHVQSGPA